MKNTIYVGTNFQTNVPVGGIIPLTITDKRFNRNCVNSEIDRVANAIAIETNGRGSRPRYNIIANVTFAATAAGNAIVALYQDGVLIPLSQATTTITTPDTEIVTVTIPASILTKCCGTTAITIVNDGTIELVVSNASIVVTEV